MSSSPNRLNQTIELPDGRILGFDRYGAEGGKPLLYCHGGASSKLDIAFADPTLADYNIDLIAIDRPGIGMSTRQPDRTLLDWSQDVRFFLTELKIEKPLPIIGWSLGGPYAMACAYALPDLIDKMALSGSCGPIGHLDSIKDLDLLLDRILFTFPDSLHWTISIMLSIYAQLPTEFVRKDLIKQMKSRFDREIVEAYTKEECKAFMQNSLTNFGWGVIDDYVAVKRPWGFPLNAIAAQVHVFHGGDDTLSPISQAHYLRSHIPKAKLHIIDNQGHFLLNRSLPDFLASLDLVKEST
ncbi:alpha/beta hydrolase [bacterium]|nr:alpha/beta hydrolase [bacterium]QQR57131.1 MAG: alpha/beta hydrolase [Candidatus Melainabacteria bacterium]